MSLEEELSVHNYEKTHFIRRGRFAEVYEVRDKEIKSIWAAKVLRRWRGGRDNLVSIKHEADILQLCAATKHVVRIEEMFVGEVKAYLILER